MLFCGLRGAHSFSRSNLIAICFAVGIIALFGSSANAQTVITVDRTLADVLNDMVPAGQTRSTRCGSNGYETVDFFQNGTLISTLITNTPCTPSTGGNTGGNTGGSSSSSNSQATLNYVEKALANRASRYFRDRAQMSPCGYGQSVAGSSSSSTGGDTSGFNPSLFSYGTGSTFRNDEFDLAMHILALDFGFGFSPEGLPFNFGVIGTVGDVDGDFDDLGIGFSQSDVSVTGFGCAETNFGINVGAFAGGQFGDGNFDDGFNSGSFSTTSFGGGLNVSRPYQFGAVRLIPSLSAYAYHFLMFGIDIGGIDQDDRSEYGIGGSVGLEARYLYQFTPVAFFAPFAYFNLGGEIGDTADFDDQDSGFGTASAGFGVDFGINENVEFGISVGAEAVGSDSSNIGGTLQTRIRF